MSAQIAKKRLASGIYLLRFNTQYELASTFLRVQEHYESKEFAGRVFSVEQYMDWYAAVHGDFTYFVDWSGFNVPSTALRPFYEGKFDPLLEKEKRFLRLFDRMRSPFYVIGVTADAPRADYIHELAHAFYFSDLSYRRAVRSAMRSFDTSALRRELSEMGYARHVISDEVHAYLVAPSGATGRSGSALTPLRRTLRSHFRRKMRELGIRL
jgi:hypothetical protein